MLTIFEMWMPSLRTLGKKTLAYELNSWDAYESMHEMKVINLYYFFGCDNLVSLLGCPHMDFHHYFHLTFWFLFVTVSPGHLLKCTVPIPSKHSIGSQQLEKYAFQMKI